MPAPRLMTEASQFTRGFCEKPRPTPVHWRQPLGSPSKPSQQWLTFLRLAHENARPMPTGVEDCYMPPRRSFRHSQGGCASPAQIPFFAFFASCSAAMWSLE
jgi:hypothetical protein